MPYSSEPRRSRGVAAAALAKGVGEFMPEAARVLIADDHPLMRGALSQAVSQTLPRAEIHEAGSLEQVIAAARRRPARAPLDLMLLDLTMPGMNGFSGLFLIRAEFPAIPVVVVSASEDAVTVSRALDFGASGFIPKSAPFERIADAIRAVLAGDLWFPDHVEPAGRAEDAAFAQRLGSLTPQQLRVLTMVATGKLNKQIAHDMQVTEATVKAHVTMILRKLGVASRTQAVIAAGRLLVTEPVLVTEPLGAAEPAAPAMRGARPA